MQPDDGLPYNADRVIGRLAQRIGELVEANCKLEDVIASLIEERKATPTP